MPRGFYIWGVMAVLMLTSLASSCAPIAPTYPLGMSEAQWTQLSPDQKLQAQTKQAEISRLAAEQREREELQAKRLALASQIRNRLGIQQEEWLALLPEKRLAMLEDQERINRETQQRQEELGISRRNADAQTAAATAALEANRIEKQRQREELYNNPIYGNVAECTLSGGVAKFQKGAFSDDWRPIAPTYFTIAKGDGKQVSYQRQDKPKHDGGFWVEFASSGQEFKFCAEQDTSRQYKRCRRHTVSAASLEQGVSMDVSIPSVIDNGVLACKLAPGRGQPQRVINQ